MDSKSKSAAAAQRSIQCAKAALLLSSLRSSLARNTTAAATAEERDVLEMEKTVVNLKVDLARERVKMREMKLCGVMEVLLQMMVLISVWSLVLILTLSWLNEQLAQ